MEPYLTWPHEQGTGASWEKNAANVEGEYFLDVPMSSDPITGRSK